MSRIKQCLIILAIGIKQNILKFIRPKFRHTLKTILCKVDVKLN